MTCFVGRISIQGTADHQRKTNIWVFLIVPYQQKNFCIPRQQGSRGQHGAHLGLVGPRWAPCWPHVSCYQGILTAQNILSRTPCSSICMIWLIVFTTKSQFEFNEPYIHWSRYDHTDICQTIRIKGTVYITIIVTDIEHLPHSFSDVFFTISFIIIIIIIIIIITILLLLSLLLLLLLLLLSLLLLLLLLVASSSLSLLLS